MAGIEDSLLAFQQFMSNTFGIPAGWFQFPQIIFYFLIPLLALIFMWYTLLNRKIRIFRRSSLANFGVAVLIALVASSVIAMFSPPLILAIALGTTVIFWRTRLSLVTIILGLLVAGVVFFFYPNLLSLVQNLAIG